ncbi:hypothetical protein WA026_010466 [Henosepilachna vigintioctopunctata]|uniref:Carboxylesterase type B domain-containing protein n=1 Tax=Henosepilachna vigintioctopunctata TaxID=420089 RepID=A0AAW1VD80_9CUCU
MLRLTLCYLFTLYFLKIFGAKERADRLPVISIPNQGEIKGVEISKNRVHKIIAYYGIPYAQAPLEHLRFAPPMVDPLPSWEGVRNLASYKPSCLQNPEDFRDEDLPFFKLITNITDIELSEDCLYLNIFVPMGNVPAGGFATVVWFHPGHFTTGSPVFWNPHTLVYSQRVIIVTVAFRINIFGFLTTMDGEAPGNFGLMDQQASLTWIKNNIEKFSGNPNNVCLMGYGTGGTSIGIHMINSESKQLFHKAIIMSSNILSTTEIKEPAEQKEYLDNIAHTFGCDRTPTSQLLECLRRADGKDLIKFTVNTNWKPVIDVGLSNKSNGFIPEPPNSYFERGDFHKIPILSGYTHMEKVLGIDQIKNISGQASSDYLNGLLKDVITSDTVFPNMSDPNCGSNNTELITDAIIFFYGSTNPSVTANELLKIIADFTTEKNFAASTFLLATYSSKFEPTFMYRFDMKPVTESAVEQLPEWVTVPHLFDLLYVWGVPYWTTSDETQWAYSDKRIADTIMSLWMNFAKTSDPTEGSIYPITWEPFQSDKPGILIVNRTFDMSHSKNLNYKAFEFWNDYYPKIVKMASQCCSFTDSVGIVTFSYHTLLIWFPFHIYYEVSYGI